MGSDWIAKITHRSKYVITDRKEDYPIYNEEFDMHLNEDGEEWPYDNVYNYVGEVKMVEVVE